jgi:MurE/MurF fusion protein
MMGAPILAPMKLAELIQDLTGHRLLGGDGNIPVGAVRDDSRAIEPGDVFVAVRGLRADGHRFAPQAVERGAAALVVEEPVAAGVPQVVVPSAADALGLLSARRLGRPTDRMTLVGITGTNGKTTTTFLLESILGAAGAHPGVIGTVSYRYGGATYPAPYTTPPPGELQRAFAAMLEAGTTHAVMEVSSFALSMRRVAGVTFQVAAFSNLTQDHLDVHDSMESYRAAKQLLFSRHLAADGVAVLNADDPASAAMAEAAGPRRVLRVSSRGAAADVAALRFESTIDGIRADVVTPRGPLEIETSVLIGQFNVDNLLMAVGVGEALGIPLDRIAAGIRAVPGVPGRVQRVPNQQGLDILVDYAHTPDALINVLGAVRPLVKRRLICVFGCGGDRDPGKRPIMGAAVASAADLAVVTSDNPRTEDPRAIIDMILPSVPDPFFVDPDRRVAIRAAIAEAVPGDVVVIAGKGHEDYQILGREKIHFDDVEEAAEAARLREGFTLADVLRETGARLVQPGNPPPDSFARVHFDGRKAAPGDLYTAIRGETHDGHDFCAQAVAAGATGLLVDEAQVDRVRAAVGDRPAVLAAPDSRAALGAIARFHRRRWGGKLVGVTGSAGKTTTKELAAAALSAAGRVHRSAASLNNETGVPLSLLGLRRFHDYAVIEMGMRHLGDIAYLAGIAEPDVGVVVNAGIAHVGVVGSVEAIARGKSEIFAGLPPHGCAVLPADDARLRGYAGAAPRRITFGEVEEADVRLTDYRQVEGPRGPAGSEIDLAIAGADRPVTQVSARLAVVGRHVAVDAACAVAAALAVGVGPEVAARGLSTARPPRLRGELAEIAGRHLYIDCYNANPASMAAALATLTELKGGHTGLAVLGDMLELGDESAAAHLEAGRTAASLGLAVVALGDERERVVAGARAAGGTAWAELDPAGAARRALAESAAGDWILVKGSRGMRLERVVAELELQGA